jgi:hypothetical protein
MPIRSVLTRAGRVAAAVAVALALLGPAPSPARAASTVQLEVHPLVGGRYEVGGWAALSVTLVNQGAPTDGYVAAETDNGTVRRYVELPAGARKVVPIYVQPGAFQTRVTVTYSESGGSVSAAADIRVLEQTSGQIAVIGDSTGALRPQLTASGQGLRPEIVSLAVSELPERPEPLSGLATIVWAGDATALTTAQRDSLAHWTADGGRLVVVAGPDWQLRTAGLEALLPVTTLAAVDAVPLEALDAWAATGEPELPAATVASGPLRPEAMAVVEAADGTVLLSLRPEGAGQVILVGADLGGDDVRGWSAAGRFWDRVAPTTAVLDQFFGGANERAEMASTMRNALATLPTLAVPPAELLLGVIVAYILLIGPISYVALRRLDRRELAWVTAPLLIVTFSACSFGIGRAIKGTDVVVNQVAVVRSTPSGTALVETFAGIFSPDRTTYAVTADADALMTTLPTDAFVGDGTTRNVDPATIEQGRPAHLRDLAIPSFGFAGVQASALASAEPALEVTWATREGEAIGTVTNVSDEPLTDVALISTGGGERIGDLASGASAEFTFGGPNLNGASAADQVYGFGGFDTATEEQRRIAMRREVINALVGYGGWGGMELVTSTRGPFVIGWHEGEGPVPVTVDGANVQRLASVVEVLPIRPSLGSGEVTVRTAQMSVSVTEMEGDVVGGFEAGSIIVNDGSVTFGIALPLEASGLQPTDVVIAVGPDASMILSDTGGFPGFWPAGYTAEVRDPTTGEWNMLGDLSNASSFSIEDPATAISPTGLIEVRITGVADAAFGQPGVFASAEVRGVLDR